MSFSLDDEQLRHRVFAKVEFADVGCWEWAGQLTDGYGRVWFGRYGARAHRVVYELLRGRIPDGLHLDHLCRNPACVRPDHLEPVTQRVNLLRGLTVPAANAAKTRCKRGHAFDEENTYYRPDGRRRCRECARLYRVAVSL